MLQLTLWTNSKILSFTIFPKESKEWQMHFWDKCKLRCFSFSLFLGSPSTPVCTLTGHSGPVTGVLLALPLALSAAGSIVRVWDVASKTCLKLLQHSDVPVTAITWISTFRGVATIDSHNILRTFSLENVENLKEEIVVASCKRLIETDSCPNNSVSAQSLQHYSPKQSLKFYGSR